MSMVRLCGRLPAALSLHYRKGDRDDRTRGVGAIAWTDAAAHGFDEASGDRQAEAGARAHPIAFLGAIELLEDALQVAVRDAAALVENLDANGVSVAPAADADGGFGWRVLGRVVEQI